MIIYKHEELDSSSDSECMHCFYTTAKGIKLPFTCIGASIPAVDNMILYWRSAVDALLRKHSGYINPSNTIRLKYKRHVGHITSGVIYHWIRTIVKETTLRYCEASQHRVRDIGIRAQKIKSSCSLQPENNPSIARYCCIDNRESVKGISKYLLPFVYGSERTSKLRQKM